MTSILNVTSNNRKSIFIASSSESLKVAKAVKSYFENDADVTIWDDNIFALNKSFLASLLDRSAFYDYAIIIMSKDDIIQTRGEQYEGPRDNSLFEFGLFMGRIGAERAFPIAEEGVKILSDFKGIEIPTYKKSKNLKAAVARACKKIKSEMDAAEETYHFSLLPSTSLAIGYYVNFIQKVLVAFQHMMEYEIFERDKDGLKINIQKRIIKNRYPTITILLPNKFSDLKPANFNKITKLLTKVEIQATARPFPFYLEGDVQDENNLQFFDIPTTLLASFETIEKIFADNFLVRKTYEGSNETIRESIERREIANFEKTLRKLLADDIENKTIKFDLIKTGDF